MSTPRLTFAQRLAGLPLIGSLLSMAPIRGRLAMLVMAAFVTFAHSHYSLSKADISNE